MSGIVEHGGAVSTRIVASSSSPPTSMDFSVAEKPEFVEKLKDICSRCNKELFLPFQTRCGHRLCRECLDAHFRKNGDPSRCPYDEEDCEEISLARNDGTQHVKQCVYGKFPCENASLGCEERLRPEEIQNHAKTCRFAPTECGFCHQERIPAANLEAHIKNDCTMVEVGCPYKCGVTLRRRELDRHMQSCPAKPVDCNFKEYGCSFQGTMEQLKEHEKADVISHLKLTVAHCNALERKVKDMESCQEESLKRFKEAQLNLEGSLKVHEQKLMRQETRIKDTQKTIANQDQELQNLKESSTAIRQSGQVAQFVERLAALERSQLELKQSVLAQQRRLPEFELRFQVLETASYNGVLIWKIRDYARRKQDAGKGSILSLYSQPFYSSPHGYRMCARVYLNGDGIGTGTHLSLFFVVMRGEYDALLPWPFRQKVVLMLLDQVGNGRDITDTFRPDLSSSSFQRPVGEMNVASGCPLFVSHAVLEAKDSVYLRDDTIFIKIVVDTEGLAGD